MLRLKDLMQRDVVAVSPDLTLRELVEVFAEREVSGAPVVTSRKVIGVISQTDIFDFREDASPVSLGPDGPSDDPEDPPRKRPGTSASDFFSDSWDPAEMGTVELMRTTRDRDLDLLNQYTVADVMTRDVLSQPSGTTLKKAAQYMLDRGIHRILVIDDGELQGIVTVTDIVRAVAEGRLKS
jgi:predicted transcriptional regulator